jgi:hypothetical protein
MRPIAHHISLLMLLLTTACSTVLEGQTQQLAIDSVPQGASCTVKNNGDIIGVVPHTPGTVTIAKSKNDILIECEKIGYGRGRAQDHANTAITSLGNLVFGQLSMVGNLVDSASGAGHKYTSTVFVELEKDPMMAMIPTQPIFTQPNFQTAAPVANVAITPLPVPGSQANLTPSQQLGQALMNQQATIVTKTPQETAAMLLGQPASAAPATTPSASTTQQLAQLSPAVSADQLNRRPPFDVTQ